MSFGFGVGDFIAVFDKAKKYRDRYKEIPGHLDSLRREITALHAVIDGIDNIKAQLGDYERKALEAPIHESTKLLGEIEKISDANGCSDQNSKPTLLARLGVKTEELQQLRVRISLNVQILTVIKQFGDSQVALDIRRNVKSLHDEQKNQQELKILEWLDPNNYEPLYQDYLSQRQGNSGKWFLDSSDFSTWVSVKGQSLLCLGIPGSGKTIMSSIAIHHLHCQFQDEETTAIAYIFCNSQNQEEGTFHHYISNLAKQLAQRRFPQSLKALYEKHQNTRSSRHEDDTKKLLTELANTCGQRLFIIIDALDECNEDVRKDLVAYMSILQQESSANVLFTTRPIPEICDFCNAKLKQCQHIGIRARGNDIRDFVSSRIPSDNKRLQDPELRNEIVNVILRRSDGMFLLAKLMIDSAMAEILPRKIRKALKSAPQEYSDYYQRTWHRIKCQKRGDADLGTKVISWVVCAKRPLRLVELQHALAIDDELEIDEENIYSKEEILSACLGLVRIDAKTTLHLVHQTAVEFFEGEKDKEDFFPCANAEIATVCVRYLSLKQTQKWAAQCNYKMNDKTPETHAPFCHYAAVHWGNHARDAHHARDDQQLSQGIRKFLDDATALETSWKILKVENKGPWRQVPCSRAHIAAYLGIRHVFEDKLLPAKETIACKGESRHMPLYFAVEGAHLEIVKLLLRSPLLLPRLRVPHFSQVKASTSQSLTIHSESYRLAIRKAVDYELVEMVDVLIKFCAQHQIQAELSGSQSESLLHQALYKDPSIYKALFGQHGTGEGFTKATLSELSELGLEVEETSNGKTPLIAAASHGNHTAVELLLAIGANTEAQDEKGYTALCDVVMHRSSEQLVQLLVDYGANLDVRPEGQSLISIAARFSQHPAVVSYLIDTLLQNPNAKNDDGSLPIEWALAELKGHYQYSHFTEESTKGKEDIVKILLKSLDVHDRLQFYCTALKLAGHHKRWDLVQFLVTQMDLDNDSWNDWKYTQEKEAVTYFETLPWGRKRVNIRGTWYYLKR